MKLLKLFSIALIFVFAGCNETLLETESLTDDVLKSGKNNPLTFETEFQIWLDVRSDVYVENGHVFFDQTILGSGNARHLGKTKLITEETLDITTSPFIKGMAHVTFVAANGDELHFETTSDMSALEYPIVRIESTGSTFLYGTGRFKKAKDGELHKVGMFNDDPEVLRGTASYTAIVTF